MESFKQVSSRIQTLVLESLDTKPETWTMVKSNDVESIYRFTIEDQIYLVFFKLPINNNKPTMVDFGSIDPNTHDLVYTMTNTGNQYKVLMTVLDTIKDFIKQRNPAGITFSARKGINDKDSKSRASVYHRMVKKFLSNDNFELTTKDKGHEVHFYLLKKSS